MTTRKLTQLGTVTTLNDSDQLLANSNGSVSINVSNFRKVMSRMDINKISNTTSYTMVLTDSGATLEGDNASAMTITIVNDLVVPWYDGSNFTVVQSGAGSVTIQAGAGVTINVPITRSLTLAGQHAIASFYRSSANVWIGGGDLAVA